MRRVTKARWNHDERGATAVEYGLIAGLLALGITGSLVTTKTSFNGVFSAIAGGVGSSAGAPAVTVTPLKTVATSTRSSYWSSKTLAASPTSTTNGAVTTKVFTFTDGTKATLKTGVGGNSDTSLVISDSTNMQTNSMYTDAQARPFQFVEYLYYDAAMTSPSESHFLDNSGSSMGTPPIAYEDNNAKYNPDGSTQYRTVTYQSQISSTVNAAMASQYQDLKFFLQQ